MPLALAKGADWRRSEAGSHFGALSPFRRLNRQRNAGFLLVKRRNKVTYSVSTYRPGCKDGTEVSDWSSKDEQSGIVTKRLAEYELT